MVEVPLLTPELLDSLGQGWGRARTSGGASAPWGLRRSGATN
jgi:hypothetical protein